MNQKSIIVHFEIDGQWSVNDFASFLRNFEDLYKFKLAIEEFDERLPEIIRNSSTSVGQNWSRRLSSARPREGEGVFNDRKKKNAGKEIEDAENECLNKNAESKNKTNILYDIYLMEQFLSSFEKIQSERILYKSKGADKSLELLKKSIIKGLSLELKVKRIKYSSPGFYRNIGVYCFVWYSECIKRDSYGIRLSDNRTKKKKYS